MTARGSRWRSLRIRNYRFYFVGQSISATGSWMQKIGHAWLVLELTGSGVWLGAVAALQQLPVLLLGAWAGLVVDRTDKHRLLMITQSIACALALVLGALTAAGLMKVWMVLVLALLAGAADAFDRPTRHTFVMEMVGPDDLRNAITLNNVVMNASKSVGPAIAGLLIATVGLSASFFVNALSYVAVIAMLAAMDVPALLKVEPAERRPGQLRDGLRHVRETPGLVTPLIIMTLSGLVAYEWTTTLPLFARDAFGGGAETFGLMFSAMGIGAVLGGLVIAGSMPISDRSLVITALVFSSGLTIVGLAPTLPIALIALLGLGASSIALKSLAATILQLRARPDMRGRVVALFSVAIAGTTPVGGPLVGMIGEAFGGRTAILFGGVGSALAAGLTVIYLRRTARSSDARSGAALTEGEMAIATTT